MDQGNSTTGVRRASWEELSLRNLFWMPGAWEVVIKGMASEHMQSAFPLALSDFPLPLYIFGF